MKTNDRHILVLGLGLSGRAAAKLMQSENCRVTAVDARAVAGHGNVAIQELAHSGVHVVDELDKVMHEHADLCIVSPGISATHPWLSWVRERGVSVLPEFEVGWFRSCNRTIAITGSNGKSTITKWIAESLQDSGISSVPCGNYGLPVCEIMAGGAEPEVFVMELSSFQLETSQQFCPDAGLLLNILPNHLDRHGDFETYLRIKMRIFEHLTPEKPAVIPDEWYERACLLYPDRNWIRFGTSSSSDFRYESARIYHQGVLYADLRDTLYGNDVMGSSVAGALAILHAFGVPAERAIHTLRRMQRLPHRQEVVGACQGINFVNDSKATNLAALCAAIKSCDKPLRLIAGGQAKEKDFDSIKEVLAHDVKTVYLIGKDAENMAACWRSVVSCIMCNTLENAVHRAWDDAKEGETVLLSPGCTSYDQFNSFEERGHEFAALIRNLDTEV